MNDTDQGYAADNNFAGDAYRATAGIGDNPDTNLAPTRDMNSGTTSVGATNENADVAPLGGASTPGVRSGFDDGTTPANLTGNTITTGVADDATDALAGNEMDPKTGGTVLNEPGTDLTSAARNAGDNVEGAVHGVIGDVTNPDNPTR